MKNIEFKAKKEFPIPNKNNGSKFYLYYDNNITTQEFAELHSSVGWGKLQDYDLELIGKVIKKTSNIYVRDMYEKLVGLTRVFSDNIFTSYIADIVVNPEYQKQGIGTEMLEMVKQNFKGTGIFCEANFASSKLLENCGFIKRDNMFVYSLKN